MKILLASFLRSAWAVAAGIATVLVLVFGTVLLFLPAWTQPGGFPVSAPALTGLLALEAFAGLAGAAIAVLLAPRAPVVHGVILGGLVLVLNLITVLPPDSPWPLIPAIVLLALVPVQTWGGIGLGLRGRRRREREQLLKAPAAASGT